MEKRNSLRTKETLKNSIYAILSYLMLGVTTIFVRKLFVQYLPLEFLGYEGLFGNIFSLFSLADLGIGTLITYRLYPAFASGDKEKIAKLINMYKYVLRIVGFAVLLIGSALVPFLHFIIKDNSLDWQYIYFVYMMRLLTTLCTYFLAYKRLLYTVDQCEYDCVKVDTICTFIAQIVNIAVILLFKNYILYLFVNVLSSIVSNCIVAIKAREKYGYINRKVKICRKELMQEGFWKDMKNYLVQKLSGLIYGSTDNIIISSVLGIKSVALLENYSLATGYINTVFNKIMNPFQASIANFVHSKDTNRGEELFRMFDLAGFMLAVFICVSYYILLNPLMEIWLGVNYVIEFSYVMAFVLNQYIAWNHKFLTYYRYSFGKYELDRNYILAGAILNVVISVLLAKTMGFAGIMFGTAVGNMGFWIGRAKVVYSEYLKENIKYYIFRQIRNFVLLILQLLFMQFICYYISSGILGFVIKLCLCLIVPNFINLIVFYKTKEMKMALQYIRNINKIVKNEIVKK